MWVRHRRGFDRLVAGDVAGARADLALPQRMYSQQGPHYQLARPFAAYLLELAGDDDAFTREHTTWREHPYAYQQRMWYALRFAAGEIGEDAFLAQPGDNTAANDLVLLRALREEREHRDQDALRDYRAWLAAPAWRRLEVPDPFLEDVVAWRIEALTRGR
jgi:hypothetical protein